MATPSPSLVINGRYQVSGPPIGQGGMGVVYKAYDTVTKRHVAVKTLRSSLGPAALELFAKEWSVLAQLSHPNIVDVLDTGEFEQDGEKMPFFVMPFLPGSTLDQLMRNASQRLTVERVVGIVSQACRGLQAAHERGLIHRDLKPSNIFVMEDDAVKLIDFGVVHLVGAESVKALKGTLQFMAPEQIELKPCSAASDIFSLGVVCYEALTGRPPFARKTELDTAEAIRHAIPPPICDLNPLVSQIVSRVIHKAMAKEPYHRFSTAREFAETLQKAMKGETIERFDRAKLQPRIERAKKAQSDGDFQFASEILTELEAEGNIDPEMTLLRIQIDQAVRQKSVRQLLDSARTRLEEEEFPLALQKIQEVLAIDPENTDAIALKGTIEKQRGRYQVENWFRLVEQHVQNNSFAQARQALQEILKLDPNDMKARDLLVDVDHKEREIARAREEKEQLYQSAVTCYQRGEVSSALTKLERILEMGRRSSDSAIPDRDAQYQSLYNQIRTERDAARSAYADGRRCLADRNFTKALEICNEYLKKAPGDPIFQALKLEVEEQQRQDQSAFFADVSRRVESEPDLDRRVNILKEAAEKYPEELHLQQSLRLVRERRDLVNSIVAKARQYEERGQFSEALSQFDILRNIYAQYPGLEFETERLKKRRDDQVREESKGHWVEEIDRQVASGDYARARDLARTALAEFPEDRELIGLKKLAEANVERAAEAENWLKRGQELCFDRQFAEGLDALRKASALDNRNAVIRAALLNALVEQARSVLGQDWRSAEPLIEQALNIDGGHPLAKSLQGLVLDYKRQEVLNECVSQARELQANGDLNGALAKVEEVLRTCPNELRLTQLRTTLRNLGAVSKAPPVPESRPEPAVPSKPPEPAPRAETVTMPGQEDRSAAPDDTFGIDRSIVMVPTLPKPPKPQAEPAPKKPQPAVAAPKKNLGTQVAQQLQQWAQSNGRPSKLQWSLIAAAPILLIAGLAVTYSHRAKVPKVAPAPSQYFVDLESSLANVQYRVDGNPATSTNLRLSPGAHTVEASLAGYKPATQQISLGAGTPKPYVVSFQLEPEPVRLRLSSDLKAGKVSLDGQPPVDLQDGNFTSDAIALSADHTFSLIQGNKESLALSFRAEPGGIVTLAAPVKAKDVNAVVIADLAGRARIFATDGSLKAGLKDQPTQPIPPDGLALDQVAGNAELTLDDGKSPRTIPLETSNAPTLTIRLASDPNQGTLEVEVRVPGATVSIDGRKPRTLRAGPNSLGLLPGTHTLRFTKDGYEPLEAKVEVAKGEVRRLPAFDLKPAIRTGSLMIDGATRDAEVLIDGNSRGTTGADGSMKLDDLSPETHTIVLRKADFEDKQISRAFAVGQTVHIGGTDAQLTPFGALDFHLTPQGATITYKRADEAQAHTVENGKSVRVRAGRYVITAGANGSRQRQEQVAVESGKPLAINWTLAVIEPTAKAPTPSPKTRVTSEYFEDPSVWTGDGTWWVHKGDTTSWMRSNQGVFVIQFLRQRQNLGIVKRTKHVDWIVDQRGLGTRIDYSFDFGNLERRATADGKTESKKVKLPPAAATGESYTLQIDITQERIIVRDAQGNVLDEYQRPNRTVALGRFGFKGDVAMVIRRAEER